MSKKTTAKDKSYLEDVCDKIGEIAVHYGFTVVKPPHISNDDISKAKQFKEHDHYEDAIEKIALTKWYTENRLDLEAQPLVVHFKKPLPGHPIKKKPSVEMYGLEIMGSNKTTTEALLIKCALSILEELGHKDLYLDINSIGDKESVTKFERELSSHFKKNHHTLPSKIKQEFKKNFYSVVKNISDDTKEFMSNAPQTIGSLSENARLHFKEVLESIEAFNINYRIKPNIISNKLYASYTVFEIKKINKKEEEEILAYGYRYNHLAKKIGAKKDIPSMGVTIFIKKGDVPSKKILVKNIKKPKFYLVQIGSVAKLKALNVVELLRKNKIPVYHSITKDKITGQLNGAEYMKASHVLIMGQKEAMEESIVVRDVNTREQETVFIKDLPEFLKKMLKGDN